MKITDNELLTSTELMKDFFGMNEKLIHNLAGKRRYEKIYEYLLEETPAEKMGTRKKGDNVYTVFSWGEETYLIPRNIFDEEEEEWVEAVKTREEKNRVAVTT